MDFLEGAFLSVGWISSNVLRRVGGGADSFGWRLWLAAIFFSVISFFSVVDNATMFSSMTASFPFDPMLLTTTLSATFISFNVSLTVDEGEEDDESDDERKAEEKTLDISLSCKTVTG